MQDLDPYRPPEATVVRPIDMKGLALAARGSRLVAQVINHLLLGLAFAPFLGALVLTGEWSATDSGGDPLDRTTIATSIGFAVSAALLIVLIVVQILLLRRNRWSLGKRMLGIRIVSSDCSEVPLARLLGLRILLPSAVNAASSAFLCGLPLFTVVDACFIFGEQRRCLHDLIADTIVVRA
jgi:uncharacterized RDD family membrane protein YckC